MRSGTKTRARIEAEAIILFAARGVDATSMRDIAAAVGVVEGALYRHFSSKDDLVRHVFLTRYAALAAGILAIAEADLPFVQRVEALVGTFLNLFEKDPALFAFLLVNQHRHLAEVPLSREENAVEAMAAFFAIAVDRGEIPGQDAEWLAALALGVMIQPATFRIYGRLQGPFEAWHLSLTRALLALAQPLRLRVAATAASGHNAR